MIHSSPERKNEGISIMGGGHRTAEKEIDYLYHIIVQTYGGGIAI